MNDENDQRFPEEARETERVLGRRRNLEERPATWAARVLIDQGMPNEEIETILRASDRHLVHRYLELHVERLEEQLAVQRWTLELVERQLTKPGT